MTKDAALKFRADYIAKGARDFTKPSHFELDPAGFFEVHVEAVKLTKEDVHFLQGGTIWFRKETLDMIASAAGVSFRDLPAEKHVRGEPDIGRCQAITQGPDGQPVVGDVAEYEFDPELRAEEDILRAQVKDPAYKPSEAARRLKVLEYEKAGHQRANTGARSRATIAAVGMQTGFKDLFKDATGRPKDDEWFLFSRVIINVKNKMVAEMQLSAISGNVSRLYGPSHQLTAEAGMRHVGPGADDVPASPASPGSFEPDQETQPDPIALKKRTIADILRKYGDKLKAKTVEDTLAWIEGDQLNMISENDLDGTLANIKRALAGQGVQLGGEA